MALSVVAKGDSGGVGGVFALDGCCERASDGGGGGPGQSVTGEGGGGAGETSHALSLSSRGGWGGCGVGMWRGEGGVFVVGRLGAQAVVQDADHAVEQVALCGGVTVAGGLAAVVVGAGAG